MLGRAISMDGGRIGETYDRALLRNCLSRLGIAKTGRHATQSERENK